jgi:hypothetical protein
MKFKPTVIRLAIFLLACSLIVLSVAVKQSRFLPKSNPAHFLSKAAKMEVGNLPVSSIPLATGAIPDFLPAPAEVCAVAIPCPAGVVASQIGLTLCLQHRSPPLRRFPDTENGWRSIS